MANKLVETLSMTVMSTTIPISDINTFFSQYPKGFISNDLQAAIRGNANYLTALGLVAYTEFMGGMLLNNFTDPQKKFLSFLKGYFPSDYMKADTDLKAAGKKGLYDVVRNGLVHNYFVKLPDTNFIIYMWQRLDCGILYDATKDELKFGVVEYYQDLLNAFDKYKTDLLTGLHNAEFINAKAFLKF
jgi:hypothetical protein